MSKRLQVLLPDDEMEAIRKSAEAEQVSVGEWVRGALREQQKQRPKLTVEEKLKAVRAMSRLNLPTCDIDQMLAETESGYLSGPFPSPAE